MRKSYGTRGTTEKRYMGFKRIMEVNGNIENSSETKYEFLILKSPGSHEDDLKTILCERRIKSQADELHFCSSYKDLYAAYTARYNGEKMWGVGFPKAKIDAWIKTKQLKETPGQCGSVHYRTVNKNEIDLKDFDVSKGDFFLVVPNRVEMNKICFRGKVSGTKYYNWRCKGLNNTCCKEKTDAEITKYLNGGYRFALRNNIPIDEKELFRNYQLIPNSGVYNLL